MRYYKLAIQGGITFELSEKNPSAPRLTFNIQAFSQAFLYTPSIITLYNVSTDFFTNSQYFIDKVLTLEAGVDSSILSDKAGITPSSNNTLYIGVINRVVPNFTGLDTSVTFYVTSFKRDRTEKQQEPVNRGEVVANKLQSLLTKVLDNPNYAINVDKSASSIVSESDQTGPLIASTFDDVVQLASSYGISLALEQNTFTFYQDKFDVAAPPFIPNANDFVAQPSWETLASISCVFSLRGGLRLMQTLKMPGNLVMNLAPLLGGNQSLSGVTYKPSLIIGGDYTIKSIWHMGDSRSNSAESWATTIEAVKVGANLASGIAV